MDKLKSCPFCGSELKPVEILDFDKKLIRFDYQHIENDCILACQYRDSPIYINSNSNDIEQWNNRKDKP